MPDRSLNPRISRLRRAGVPRVFRGNCISSHRFANACLDSTVIMTKVRGMKRLDVFLVPPLPVANYCPQTHPLFAPVLYMRCPTEFSRRKLELDRLIITPRQLFMYNSACAMLLPQAPGTLNTVQVHPTTEAN